jgi:hypothetical protein
MFNPLLAGQGPDLALLKILLLRKMLSPESSCGSASRYTRAGLELDFIDLAGCF